VQWNERVSAYAYCDGQLGRDKYDSHNVSGALRISFKKKRSASWLGDAT